MANEPVAFAAILAGGWLLDRGAGDLKTAFTSGGASSSSSTTGGGGAAGAGFANPFPHGWTPGRLDYGYDGTSHGPIVSPVAGTITYAAQSFSNWGGWVEVKADHPIAGLASDTFYFAEGLAPTVKTGQHVSAGQQIAVPSSSGGAAQGVSAGTIEWGLASPGSVGTPTDPLAKSLGNAASMVLAFSHWAENVLGVAPPSLTGNAGSP